MCVCRADRPRVDALRFRGGAAHARAPPADPARRRRGAPSRFESALARARRQGSRVPSRPRKSRRRARACVWPVARCCGRARGERSGGSSRSIDVRSRPRRSISRIVAVSSQVPLLDLRTLGAPLAPYAARVAALRVNGESSSPSSSSPPHQRVPFSSSSPSHAHTRRRRRRHHHRQAPLVLITPIFRLRAASPPTLRLGAARRMAAATRAQTMRRRAGAA